MEGIMMDDLTKFKFLSEIKYSPDGKYACFMVHEADVEGNTYLSNLWLYTAATGKYFKLTSFNKVGGFIWFKDNENILFSEIRDTKDKDRLASGEEFTVFYKIDIHGGEANEAFRIPMNVEKFMQTGSGEILFSSTYNPYNRNLNDIDDDEKQRELKRRSEEKDYEVLEEIPFWANGGGFTSKKRTRLYIYSDVSKKCEPITSEELNVDFFNTNSDNTKAVIIGFKNNGTMALNNYLYIADLNTKDITEFNNNECFTYYYAGFLKDDRIMALGSDMKQYGLNENEKFYLIDINSGEKSCITPELDMSIGNSVGCDCRYGSSESVIIRDGHMYFIATESYCSYLNSINEEGHVERVVLEDGTVDGFDVANGEILFIGMRGMKLQELYSIDGGLEKQVTAFNDQVLKDKKVIHPEKLTVETEKGVFIDGWVIKPADCDESKKYPAILDIHGGPKAAYGEVYFHEMQCWANQGYFVFFCNPRGSDGRGDDFADIRGKYGTIDYDDIMKFTDAVLEKYTAIDSSRVGVTGGSYGGYMTNWIIGHTGRFSAAATQRSISNWTSMFCTTDIGYFFADDQIGGTPWNNQEKLWNHSPLKYADKVKTPTLVLHSEEDYRCWLTEGIQMFTALKYNGVDARLCMFRGENHELSRSGKPKHRLRRLEEITGWFNKYLRVQNTGSPS